jgi:hypothetical protein
MTSTGTRFLELAERVRPPEIRLAMNRRHAKVPGGLRARRVPRATDRGAAKPRKPPRAAPLALAAESAA